MLARPELRRDNKDWVDELALRYRIGLRDPADLPFADCLHRLVAFDGHAPSTDRNPRLAVIRFLMNRWSCSMMLFR